MHEAHIIETQCRERLKDWDEELRSGYVENWTDAQAKALLDIIDAQRAIIAEHHRILGYCNHCKVESGDES